MHGIYSHDEGTREKVGVFILILMLNGYALPRVDTFYGPSGLRSLFALIDCSSFVNTSGLGHTNINAFFRSLPLESIDRFYIRCYRHIFLQS